MVPEPSSGLWKRGFKTVITHPFKSVAERRFTRRATTRATRVARAGESLPFAEIQAHMHMLCAYSLRRSQRPSIAFPAINTYKSYMYSLSI